MNINTVERIDDRVAVKNILISVSNKQGLETLVPTLLDLNPEVRIFSTGGTFAILKTLLGDKAAAHLTQVSDYTGQPETQGGLVKTLDFKIYLGLLTETYNPDHQKDLARTKSVSIDMAVVNLYPFQETIAAKDATLEKARGNIDIGGPCMIRASAKNFLRVASVVDPSDYPMITDALKTNNNHTTLALRYHLARKAFTHTAEYDKAIADYLTQIDVHAVSACYRSGEIPG
jgi:phosphoribosylaminoimidazolecarboxamide formyltransferase / IMP cyclohydrolase